MIRYAVLGSGSSANSYIIQYTPSGDTACSESISRTEEDENRKITIVIDNGFSLKEFKRRAEETGFKPEDIDFIFLTHDHSDHIKGISVLSSRYSIPVVMCRSTVFI